MLRRIINNLVLHRGDVVVLDMEAGLEHMGREMCIRDRPFSAAILIGATGMDFSNKSKFAIITSK